MEGDQTIQTVNRAYLPHDAGIQAARSQFARFDEALADALLARRLAREKHAVAAEQRYRPFLSVRDRFI